MGKTLAAPPPLFPDQDTGRQPPVALEAEVSVLGACMIDPDAISKAAEVLPTADAFYREGHRRIYRAMLRMFERGDPVEPTALAEELTLTSELEQAGGLPYLAELLDAVPTAANVEYHARIVSDRAVLRRLIEAGTAIVQAGYDPGERGVEAVIDDAERRIMEVGDTRSTGRMADMRQAMTAAIERLEEIQSADGIIGVPTGYRDLDGMTGGFQPANLVILAGRPSMGKSALMTGHILAAAVEARKRVAVFSFEMTKEEIVHRMMCWEGLVDLGKLLRGKLDDDEYGRLSHASNRIHDAPLWIEDSGRPTVLDVRARSRRLVAEEGPLDLVLVDYLQLMYGGDRTENRQQEVSEISRGLKELARELRCPVVALSQLSRKPEDRSDKRPQLSDLRESGAIEQDADLVLFVHRPEYYLKDAEIQEKGLRGVTELIIGKQRNGPTGTVELFFRKESARFESAARTGPGWS